MPTRPNWLRAWQPKAVTRCDPDGPAFFARGLEDWKPEVITLDLCMPEEDGIGVFATLHESGFQGELVIISGQDDWLRKTASRLASARG